MNRDPSVAGLASLVQSRGRHGDTMLVHMSPEEVQGLQRVALAAGGSLTINPDTGLVEANFLKKLLPTLLGVGLSFIPGVGPLAAAGLVGAGETIRTGDLGKGLMAGLGAYGGAGLAGGLAGAGTLAKAGVDKVALQQTLGGEAAKSTLQTAAQEAAKQGVKTYGSNILGGVSALKDAGLSAAAKGLGSTLGATGIGSLGMTAANVMTPDYQLPDMTGEIDDSYYQSEGYDPVTGTFRGGQWRKGYPGFPGYAMGGAVMPRANFNYPQAGISKSSYAPTIDYTQPREVLDGYEVKLDPFTGEEKFAEGGEVGMMAPDELKNFLTVSPGAPPPQNNPAYQQQLAFQQGNSEEAIRNRIQSQLNDAFSASQAAGKSILDSAQEQDALSSQLYKQYGLNPVRATTAGSGASMMADFLPEPIGLGPMEPGVSAPRLPMAGEPGFGTSQGLRPSPLAAAPQQSLEQYYQGLLTPPQQRPADDSFMNYMRSLNNYVTSPVAPPPPPPQPPQTPPANPPGDPRVTGTGGTGTGMRWDPTQGKFVPGTGSVGDTGIDFSELQNLVNSGMFSGFNFGDLGNFLQNGGYGSTTGLTYDPATGSFRQPGTQTTTTPPGTATTDLNQNQNQFDPNQFKFDQDGFQFNPFVDGFDMSSLPGYGQNTTTQLPDDFMNSYLMQSPAGRSEPPPDFTGATGNLTGIDQFADPSYNQPFQYDFSGLGQMGDLNAMSGMGDMGGYGTQFQGFQPLSTDFGSTYQAPAMNLPTFDASAYAPQQMDFGSMGYGLGSLPSISSTYQPQAVATPTFDMSSFQMPASQSPMMTGGDTGMSNMSTAPQFGFGNSDVLYGRTDFGMGGGNNIFGFAGGGSVQRAAAGKLITGDGDGMSDDIRANINGTQEARLADGEFVIPADVVSHLGNGSTDAGADQLHAMMDRIRKARTGRTRQAPEIDPDEYMPA